MTDKSFVDQAKDAVSSAGKRLTATQARLSMSFAVLCTHTSSPVDLPRCEFRTKPQEGRKVRYGRNCWQGASQAIASGAFLCYGYHADVEQEATAQTPSLQKLFLDFLPGRVAVVTGGGRGVGQAIAEKYAELGFTLILTARSKDQLEEVPHCPALLFPVCTVTSYHFCTRYSQTGIFACHAHSVAQCCAEVRLMLNMQVAANCKARGSPQVDVHGVDLSESSQVRKFADDVLAKYKDVNVLVNNAGMGPSSGGGPIKGNMCCRISLHWHADVPLCFGLVIC